MMQCRRLIIFIDVLGFDSSYRSVFDMVIYEIHFCNALDDQELQLLTIVSFAAFVIIFSVFLFDCTRD
jgi:hypothetical protein